MTNFGQLAFNILLDGNVDITVKWPEFKNDDEKSAFCLVYAQMICSSIRPEMISYVQEKLLETGDDIAKRILFVVNKYVSTINVKNDNEPIIHPMKVFKDRNT